ncbi:hypothetical protein RRG08_014661 [Elysia crispata]|uniref:Uncharacterized protein n=1 Tax=Elysia crispata TaxID=231223 RepID=A0AAE0YHW3_9GAST|nr:hypothetical protein RRG08_014661 [Elysia crispata]
MECVQFIRISRLDFKMFGISKDTVSPLSFESGGHRRASRHLKDKICWSMERNSIRAVRRQNDLQFWSGHSWLASPESYCNSPLVTSDQLYYQRFHPDTPSSPVPWRLFEAGGIVGRTNYGILVAPKMAFRHRGNSHVIGLKEKVACEWFWFIPTTLQCAYYFVHHDISPTSVKETEGWQVSTLALNREELTTRRDTAKHAAWRIRLQSTWRLQRLRRL